METTLRLRTRVLPGKRIEITAQELREGAEVEVAISAAEPEDASPPSAVQVIQALRGHGSFGTAAEVDRYLEAERDSWDR